MPTALQIAGRAAGSAAILNVAYRAALRPRLETWGASDEEVRATLPGAEMAHASKDRPRPMGEPVPVAVGS